MIPPPFQAESGPKDIVIMGCGRLGASIVSALMESGHIVHILDLNADNFDRLPSGMIEDGYIIPVTGNGTSEEDLRRAGIQDADIFIAVSGRDTQNALASQIAQHIFQVPKVICRMNDPARKEMYDELGLVAISSTAIITQMFVEAARA